MGPHTVSLTLEHPVNSLCLNKAATQVAVAGRNVFKIINVDEEFEEVLNLRVGKYSLNYSIADVAWNHNDDHILASGSTNGSVIIWDLNKKSKSKLDCVFSEHKRAVNRVCFQRTEVSCLLTADNNGYMKFFDLRLREPALTFIEHAQSNVRDIQFSPFDTVSFCAASESGTIQMWDIRRPESCVWYHIAQSGPVYTIDWHPEERNWIATAGRAQIIKVWDISNTDDMTLTFSIQTISDVARIRWRPQRRYHIASCALQLDCNINVWDVRRPFIPFAAFEEHTDVAKDIIWKHNPQIMFSGGRDNMLIRHHFSDAKRPADDAIPAGLNISSAGHVTFSVPQKPVPNMVNKLNSRVSTIPTFFKKSEDKGDIFLDQITSVSFSTQPLDVVEELEMKWFVETAKKYVLVGQPFHQLCDINAKVSAHLNRHQVSQIWTTLKLLFPATKHSSKVAIKTTHSVTPTIDLDQDKGGKLKGKRRRVLEHDASTSGRSDEDSDSDSKLAQIASAVSDMNGHTFFIADDIEGSYDRHDTIFDPSKTDLTLPVEAFHHRHVIDVNPRPPEDLESVADSPASANESDLSASVQPQPMEPQLCTMQPITEQIPKFSPTCLIVNMLKQLAEEGDVQSSVCMLLVLGPRIQSHIQENLQEHWCISYIDLLNRFKLWNKANEIINLCNIAEVTSLNQSSTTVHTKCDKCNKALAVSGYWCARCKRHTNPCSLCNQPVKGLYVWCQGCSHGGHINHMKTWFTSHKLCPTGCGHLCEFT